jgi:hypothetical protein
MGIVMGYSAGGVIAYRIFVWKTATRKTMAWVGR